MKICPNCKSQNFDVKTVCERCGCPLPKNQFETVVTIPNNNPTNTTFYITNTQQTNRGLRIAINVFLIISCVLSAISMFSLSILWMVSLVAGIELLTTVYLISAILYLARMIVGICMTVKYQKKTDNDRRVGVGFKICTLLFVNLIAGILMLCDND